MIEEETHEEKDDDGSGGAWLVLTIIGIIFLPALIFYIVSYWVILRKMHHKFSVCLVYGGIVITGSLLYILSKGSLSLFINTVTDYQNLLDNWAVLLHFYVPVVLILGSVLFLAQTFVETRKIVKRDPATTEVSTSWAHNFKFRKTPLEKLAIKRRYDNLKKGSLLKQERVPLGLNEESGHVVYRYNEEARKQTLIVGASGSGKTITMLNMILGDIKNGHSIIVTDFKRSPQLSSKLATWAKENGANFKHFVDGHEYNIPNSPGQSYYDPLTGSSVQAMVDRLLNMRKWDTNSDVHKNNFREVIQSVVVLASTIVKDKNKRLYLSKGEGVSAKNYLGNLSEGKIDLKHGWLTLIASMLTADNIEGAINSINATMNGYTQENPKVGSEIVNFDDQRLYSNLSPFREKIKARGELSSPFQQLSAILRTNIMSSSLGDFLGKPEDSDARFIDLYEDTKNPGNVILFSLNADSEKETTQYLGSLILGNLTSVSARRRSNGDKNQVNVYLDEFQTVPVDAVSGLLEKSRESALAMTLSCQSLEQIVVNSNDASRNAVIDTCSNFIVHNGSNEDSATTMSKILGKHKVKKYSSARKNESFWFSINFSNRRNQKINETDETVWVIDPSDFIGLAAPMKSNNFRSEAIVVKKSPSSGPEGVRGERTLMVPASDVLIEYDVVANDEITDTDIDDVDDLNNLVDEDFEIPVSDVPKPSKPVRTVEPVPTYDEIGEEDDDGGFGIEESSESLDDYEEEPELPIRTVENNVDSLSTNEEPDNVSKDTDLSALSGISTTSNDIFNLSGQVVAKRERDKPAVSKGVSTREAPKKVISKNDKVKTVYSSADINSDENDYENDALPDLDYEF